MKSKEELLKIAKQTKEVWVKKTEHGDIPPTVIIEKNGKVQAIVVAPEVNKFLGLHAANMCRIGFNPDSLTLLFDANMATGEKIPEGMSDEEKEKFKKDFEAKYPPGSMQKLKQEGKGQDILDVVLCHTIDKDCNIKLFVLPYSYENKKFNWIENHDLAQTNEEDTQYKKLEGSLPERLRKIMSAPPIQEMPEFDSVMKAAEKIEDFSESKRDFYIARTVLDMLSKEGFHCTDLLEVPEGEEKYLKFEEVASAAKAAENKNKVALIDTIPLEVRPAIVLSLSANNGKMTMVPHLMGVLEQYRNSLLENAKKHGYNVSLEEIALEVVRSFTKISKELEKEKKDKQPPYRVKVHSGDGKEFIGYGTYTGNVKVYLLAMPDGSIQSLPDAEKPIPESEIPEGAQLIEAGLNPKIEMEDGTVRYGCQVWWERL